MIPSSLHTNHNLLVYLRMLDWSNIDTVFLDMDGTLLDLNFDNYFWLQHLPVRYAESRNISLTESKKTLQALTQRQEGLLNWYCVDYWSVTLGVDICQLKEEVQHLIAFRPHVKPFLDALKKAGKRRILLTNAHPKSILLKSRITRLDHFVDDIISAHPLSFPKEDRHFWPLLQNKIPFQPDKTLLIDDSLAVLLSAQNYGIRYLFAILKPDSQSSEKNISEFTMLSSFEGILPK